VFKKIIIASVLLYIFAHILATAAMDDCMGWNCAEVTCPDGYAVEVPGEGYLPCEKVNEYINTNNKELLK
jgi:hypothetical protein